MLTEKEAREKWCPFALVPTQIAKFGNAVNERTTYEFHPSASNRHPGPEPREGCQCIASDCMAWRWRRRYADDKKDAEISHCTGYCGLGGKP